MKTINDLVNKNEDKLKRMNAPDTKDYPVRKVLIFEKNYAHNDDLIDIKPCPLTPVKNKGVHALMVGGVITTGYNNVELYSCEVRVDWMTVFEWCVNEGIRVVCMSVGSWRTDEREAALKMYRDWGGIVVAANGNKDDRGVYYPANSPYTIGVSATNTEDTNSEELDITTESFWFAKRYGRDSFRSFSGTSCTAPVIAFSALIYSLHNPTARVDDFRRWLFRNSYLELDNDVPGRLEDDERFFIFPDDLIDEEIRNRETTLTLRLDNKNMVLNEEVIPLRVAPFLKQYSEEYSALCTELRPIFEALGGNVAWNNNTKTVTIEFK